MSLILGKENLIKFINKLSENYKIIAPVEEKGMTNFRPVNSDELGKINLTYSKTTKSPKEFLFPQSQTLCSYKYSGRDVEVKPPEEDNSKRAILGLHPCDVRAILIQDKLFNWDYKDELYFKEREKTLLLSMNCNRPDWSCFCPSVGGDPHNGDGADINFTDLEDRFYVESKSDKGKELLDSLKELFKDSSETDKKQVEELQKKIRDRLPVKFNSEKVTENLNYIFEDKIWDTMADKCVNCGTCAYLCPTCHCFDITDEGNYEEGKRVRCWDTCMAGHFTRMAGGHNPRDAAKTRYRQRIYHKFNYYVKNFKTLSCVGCGRCISECPAGMDLVKSLQKIGEIERDK